MLNIAERMMILHQYEDYYDSNIKETAYCVVSDNFSCRFLIFFAKALYTIRISPYTCLSEL